MDTRIRGCRAISYSILFGLILSLLAGCASAQCGDCEDNDPCTRDSCNGTQCEHKPQDCNPSGSLSGTSTETESSTAPSGPAPGLVTDGANANVEPGSLETEIPTGSTAPSCDNINCDDGNACTDDSCDPDTGKCAHQNNAAPCDDGNDCTTDDTCTDGTCAGAARNCDDDNDCTDDSCNPATGCVNANNAAPCDDGNACTTDDTCSGGSCQGVELACNDGNESTEDSCQEGVCIYQPISTNENDDGRSDSEETTQNPSRSSWNNSTTGFAAVSSEQAKGQGCIDNKNCSDDNSSTYDFCYNGACHHTTTLCNDKNNCTIDSFDGEKCVFLPIKCDDGDPCTDDSCDPATGKCVRTNNTAPCDDGNACTKGDTCSSGSCKGVAVKCDDHNPCTYDRCNRQKGCYYPSKCDKGKTCIDGTCRYPYYYYYPYYFYYPYYPYYPYDMPYGQPTPAVATQTASKPQSYIMPAGTYITLPWGGTMLAAEDLQVYNGLAYPGATPVSLNRDLGSPAQVASIGRMALSATNQWEMIGLSWKDGGFRMTLIQPNQTVLPTQGDGRNVVHPTGSNYDYYLLKSPMAGIWTVQIVPVNAASSGTGYTLISGLVQGPIPPNQA